MPWLIAICIGHWRAFGEQLSTSVCVFVSMCVFVCLCLFFSVYFCEYTWMSVDCVSVWNCVFVKVCVCVCVCVTAPSLAGRKL